jgi:hypothetical protein
VSIIAILRLWLVVRIEDGDKKEVLVINSEGKEQTATLV